MFTRWREAFAGQVTGRSYYQSVLQSCGQVLLLVHICLCGLSMNKRRPMVGTRTENAYMFLRLRLRS